MNGYSGLPKQLTEKMNDGANKVAYAFNPNIVDESQRPQRLINANLIYRLVRLAKTS